MARRSSFDGKAYQARFDALAASGVDMHGEATFVRAFAPRRVLDAGCGTGRVAIELARHGIAVIGVDVDPSMIAEARRLAPALSFFEANLAGLCLGETFDVVVLAGNVPLFCPAAARDDLVSSCAAHVVPGGVLVAGFQLGSDYSLRAYDAACREANLTLRDRYATWDRQPFVEGADYAVSVHVRQAE